jgi:hypothetical protein
MAKGLENILEKISENPRQTLVGRFLSLIADIPNEDERAGYALDLAEQLAKSKPDDALKIAYMIYGSGRHLARALKVVIECFETKGRPGKVAVLKLELEKIKRELNGQPGEAPLPLPDLKTGVGSAPAQFSFNDLSGVDEVPVAVARAQDTRMAELDLGELQEEDHTGAHTVDFLFNGKAEKEAAPLKPVKQDIKIAEGFFAGFAGRPGDTVLPVMPDKIDAAYVKGSGTAISFVGQPDPKDPSPKKTRAESPRQVPPGYEQLQRMPLSSVSFALGQDPEPNSLPVLQASNPNPRAAASEIFDRFFADRKYQEAEAVLQRSSKEQMFEWWRVRYERLKDIVTHDYKFDAELFFKSSEKNPIGKDLIAHANDIKNSAEFQTMLPFSGDFRRGFVTEILLLAKEPFATLTTPPTHKNQKKSSEEHPTLELTREFSEKLLSMPVDTEQRSALFFDLMQSLVATSPGTSLLDVIELKGLKDRSPEWLGLYLDALLRSGFARKVIVEALLQIEKQPKLSWIRVAWRRLPAAWAAMGVTGFTWSEDDGAKDFLNKINVRGQQLLRTFIDDKDIRL